MSQSFSCSMTSKHFYKVLVLFLSFSLKLTKRVEAAEQNHRVEAKAVDAAAGSQKNICAGQPLSEHLHRELNSTYSSTCDNCMSESSLKNETIFATAPQVLSIISWRCGDG